MKQNDRIIELFQIAKDAIDEIALILNLEAIDPALSEEPSVIDPLAHLRAMESLVGLEEVRDKAALMEKFQKHDIDVDPAITPWCGVAVRYAICEAGYDDPGPEMHRAINWEDYGEACDENEPGAILVHYSHVGIRTENGKEIGGNVGKNGKGATKIGEDNWFGPVVAARKPRKVERLTG